MGKKHVCKKGAPGWMTTFADMMSLLLTFFVLLLSMSEMDASRFRKVSGSLKMAFGVQRVSIFDEPPAGSSVIQQEHSAGSNDRAPMSAGQSGANLLDPQLQNIKKMQEKNEKIAEIEKQKKIEQNLKRLTATFAQELREGKIEINRKEDDLVLRIMENTAFDSYKSSLSDNFKPTLDKLADILTDVNGDIIIAGHSDDKKIQTPKYKTNWEFSAARANSLAQSLMTVGDLDPDRFTVQFHGPTKPIVKNNSDINRTKNRRIEVIIRH